MSKKKAPEPEVEPDEEPEEDFSILSDVLEERPKWITWIPTVQENLDSPYDINMARMEQLQLTDLKWDNYTIPPKKITFKNTGHTLIINAKWHYERPFLSKGPFGEPYRFSQLHFHWGRDDLEGSEHTVEGTRFPLEMHVVHYRSTYDTQEEALGNVDGLCIVVYFYQAKENLQLQELLNQIPSIKKAQCTARLKEYPLSYFIKPFTDDYFLYWGSVTAHGENYPILWLICREPFGITKEQTAVFRTVFDDGENPLEKNFHPCVPPDDRRLFHINRSVNLYSTLLPVPAEAPPPDND